ncbi:MAG: hypothetical protein AAGA12_14100 [Pseudomonadota bacterium]
MLLPFSMATQAGEVVLHTTEQAEDNFRSYVLACRAMKLTHIYRIPRKLTPNGDGTWFGTYETNLLRHGARMADPYISTAKLSLDDGVWKMSSILGARGHSDWTGVTPKEETRRRNRSRSIAEPPDGQSKHMPQKEPR